MSVAVRKVCQISGFLLLVSMLFVALSVWSYSSSDPAWNHYVSHGTTTVQNLGGVIGAYVADVALFLLGSMVFLLVGMAVWAACYLMRQHLRTALSIAWRGLVCLAAVSMMAQMLFASDPFFGPQVLAGGTVGQWLASISVHYLNRVGTSLVVVAAVTLALFVGVERRPLAAGGWRWLQSCGAWGWGLCQRLRQMLSGLQWPELRRDASLPTTWPAFGAEREDDADAEDDEEAKWLPGINAGESETLCSPLPGEGPETLLPPSALPTRRSARHRHHAPAALPSLDLLDTPAATHGDQQEEELAARARLLEQKLRDFGVDGEVVQVLPGPVITMYEYAPASGVKVSKIVNLQDDLALVMRALSVRVAPIPGKPVVGIEIPNAHRETVRLRDLLDSDVMRASDSKVSLALGKDIFGRPVVTDLVLIPHLLIAGATGSGKSVGLNSMICSLLFRATPAEVKLIMIDPKMLEFSMYEGIPHLLIPVVTNAKQAALALRRVVEEMERRYHLLAARGVRHIAQYNQVVTQEAMQQPAPALSPAMEEKAAVERLPYLVVVIDELSDLMMVSSREVEDALTRIAQMARAAGIHLIVATQRPSVDVLTGIIKANFPARISFQVTSKTDSRTILDANGAERLLGRGDMLFLGPGTSRLQRVHSAYVSEAEITRLVEAWKDLEQPHYDDSFLQPLEESVELEEQQYDEKYDEAVALVTRTGQASISMLQRRLRVGYNRAARMIEVMEKEGVIGPADGIKPREVLVRNTFDEA
jgi:S-DNA-T family DNA segregation ATPase FtsK/SpoIIIE